MMLQSLHLCCQLANDLSGCTLKLAAKRGWLWGTAIKRTWGKNQHKKQKWCIHLLPNSICLLSFISWATHSPPYSCSCDRISYQWPLSKAIIVFSPQECLYLPQVTSLWTKNMTVSHSSALFSSCQWGVLHKAGERKNYNFTKFGCFFISLTAPQGQRNFRCLSCHSPSVQITARVSDISSLLICFLLSHTTRQRLSKEADYWNPTGSTLLLCLPVPFWSCGKQGTVGLAGGQFKATETAKLTPRLRGTVQVALPAAVIPHVQDADRVLHSQFL